MFLHAVFRVVTKRHPETNMRKALMKFPFELLLVAFLVLCTYYGFSVKGHRGADGLLDGDVSSRRVACGFLGLVATYVFLLTAHSFSRMQSLTNTFVSGAAMMHAPAAMVNCIKAKHAEHDRREKHDADATSRVV